MSSDLSSSGDGTQPDWEFFTIAVVMTSIAGAFVLLRLGSRLYVTYSLAWEDYFLAIAMAFGVYATVFDCLAVKAGLGIHNDLLNKEQLMRIDKWYYFVQAPYKMGIGFTKLSILTLYYRVFAHQTFRRVVMVLIVYVSLYTLATTVATILQCIPVRRAWDKSIPGTCVQPTAQWYSYAALNMLAEVIMFFLPMPMIKRLHLPRQQKVGLFLIFAVGFFVIFCSVMRLIMIGIEKKVTDTNYTWRAGNHWTTVELNTGFICASIPALKAPFTALLRQMGFRSGGASNYRQTPSKQNYGFSGRRNTNKSNLGHALASMRSTTVHHRDDDSEEHIVRENEWAINTEITKTTTIGVAYDTAT